MLFQGSVALEDREECRARCSSRCFCARRDFLLTVIVASGNLL